MKTRSIFFHFVLLLGICWVPASFAQIKPEDNDLQNLRNSNKSRKELIQGMRKRLQNFQGKMKSMGMNAEPIQSPTSRKNALPQKRFSSEFTYGSTAQSTDTVVKPESHTDNNESLHLPTWHENKSGFYFLPFVGFSYASNVDYHSSIGPVELQRKNGYNTGYRLGYDFGNLFLEKKDHYNPNQIEGGNILSYGFS